MWDGAGDEVGWWWGWRGVRSGWTDQEGHKDWTVKKIKDNLKKKKSDLFLTETHLKKTHSLFATGYQSKTAPGLGKKVCPCLSSLRPHLMQTHVGPVHALSCYEFICLSLRLFLEVGIPLDLLFALAFILFHLLFARVHLALFLKGRNLNEISH